LANKCPTCHSENPNNLRFCGECGKKLNASAPGHPQDPGERASLTRTLETTADELVRGTLFADRYEIIEELGTGGMGRVYRVHDTKLNEEVALKFIKPEIAAEKRVVERFRNELKTARKITHPNVCRMHDLGEEGKVLYITMEYVKGEDLKSVIHRMGVLTVGKAVSIARQIAEGLTGAHKLGIVHRDLKPGNIMIDKEGQAKIMDFGIARSLAGGGTTAEGAIIGTPEYMSPEQVEGKEADQRSDIYALGIILFEMVTGRVPFEGQTPFSIANKQKSEPPPNPGKLNPQIPVELDRIILRSLEKAKEKRYQTTGELLADLATVEGALPTSEGSSAQLKPKISREITVKFTPKKLVVPTLALLVLIAAGIVLWPIIHSNKGASGLSALGQQTLAVLLFTDLSPARDQASWCEGIAETLINSLSNVRSLQVRGKYSSFLFKSQDDPRDVGRKLNAQKILTGTLQKVGNRLRVNVQLVNAADGTPIWSEKFDGKEEDIFDIQDKIASAAISRMQIGLLEKEKAGVEKRYTSNKEAYSLYLQANHIARPSESDAFLKSIPIYLEATEKDPGFVLPYIALARAYGQLYSSFGVMPRDEAYRKSKEALRKAGALDNENGEVYAVRAYLKYAFENDMAGAELDFQRALQISPWNPLVLVQHSFFLIGKGRLEEALSEKRLLEEIDPQDPQSYFDLGQCLYWSHRYDDSIIAYDKSLELDPNYLNTLCWSTFCFLARGEENKAIEMAKRIAPLDRDSYLFFRGVIEAAKGNKVDAEKHFGSSTYDTPLWAGIFYAAMGNRDIALENLTRLFNENRFNLSLAFLTHFFDKYRSDHEFVDLLKKSGFEF
jgi:serine/threonine protein kinase/tetratricopeptide (TPR) repeat protein